MARAGIASRRKAAELIEEGLVTINGETIKEPYIEVDPEKDTVKYNGEPVTLPDEKVTLILNKPVGVITTTEDEFGRQTVMDLIDREIQGLVPVGRLDKDSKGLLILTNDGDLSNMLMHPSYGIEKEYRVFLPRNPGNDIKKILRGVMVGGEVLKAEKLRYGKYNDIFITLVEGKNREIRRMLGKLGYRVEELIRVRIGNINLKALPPGRYREITDKELKDLKESINE